MKKMILIGIAISFFACDQPHSEVKINSSSPKIIDGTTSRQTTIIIYSDKVSIGNQVWATQNLKVGRYHNGDIIPVVNDPTQWANLTTGACCYYQNYLGNYAVYGMLYNWYAVHDPRGLAPAGWRIPTVADFNILRNYLGGGAIAGGKMKAIGFWFAPNLGATDEVGFHALPAGFRAGNTDVYDFNNLGLQTVFWTSESIEDGWSSNFSLESSNQMFSQHADNQIMGLSVRCIKEF